MPNSTCSRLASIALVLAAGGCDRKLVLDGPAVARTRISLSGELDVLFVIDNSASTLDKQTVFAEAFPKFAAALDAFPGGRPNLHVGVVSSTVDIGVQGFSGGDSTGCPSPAPGDNGLLQNTARILGCTPPTDRYLSDVAQADGSGRVTNYTGDLPTALSCIAQLGANGCGFEAQLEGMKRALDGTRPENAGFLRPEADLAIVILTDEDDCSAADPSIFTLPPDQVGGETDFRCQPLFALDCTPAISATEPGSYTGCKVHHGGYLHDPSEYVDFLASIKDPSMTTVSVIGGDPSSSIQVGPLALGGDTQPLALEPSCMATIDGNPAIGRPGDRIAEFESAFGDHGSYQSVCQSDYTTPLTTIAASMGAMMSPCLDGDVALSDTDAANPGVQPACTVSDIVGLGTPTQLETVMPACTMDNATTPNAAGVRPCWWVEPEASCTGPSHVEIHVERSLPPPAGAVLDVACEAAS